jgi:hypothetical protein
MIQLALKLRQQPVFIQNNAASCRARESHGTTAANDNQRAANDNIYQTKNFTHDANGNVTLTGERYIKPLLGSRKPRR